MLSVKPYSFNSFKTATTPIKSSRLNIYYCNDIHGNSDQIQGIMEGAMRFKKLHNQNDEAHFILSAGDNYSGADVKKNSFVLDLLQNVMSIDASAVGNHELDAGADGFLKSMKDKKMQFVASNVILDETNPMNEFVRKSFIKTENNVRYGFVGAMPIDFESCTKTANQKGLNVLNFENSVKAIQNEIDKLKSQGVNRIILLSHSGYEIDKQYAKAIDGIDIIIGGHSHSVVEGASHGENVIYSKSNQPVLVVQAGENGKYYGVINAEFGNDGILKKIGNTLIKSPNNKKNAIIEHIKTENLGKSPIIGFLEHSEPLAKNRRIAPCAWTNFLADAMRQEMNCDIALINSANVRKVPQEGILTERDIVESAPMKNKLLKTKITQKQLVEAIKMASKRTMSNEDGDPGLIQVSGLSYKINNKGDLLELNFIDKNNKKTPININNPSSNIIYTATYDDFVAKPKGEYPELEPMFDVEEFDYDKDEIAIQYLLKREDKSHFRVEDDGRLQILKTSQPRLISRSNQSFLNLTCPKVS